MQLSCIYKNSKIWTIVVGLLLSSSSIATNNHNSNQKYNTNSDIELKLDLLVDKHMSMHTGVYILRDIRRAYDFLDEQYFYDTYEQKGYAWVGARALKVGFLEWYLLGSWHTVLQHEYFGHGARAREFDVHVESYKIYPWEGLTRFNGERYNGKDIHRRIAIITGGYEATSLASMDQEFSWMQHKVIDNRDAIFYLSNALEQSLIFPGLERDREILSKSDLQSYINLVNSWYGRDVIKLKYLKDKFVSDWLNPFYYFSLYGVINYITEGSRYTDLLTLEVASMKMLPTCRIRLAPFGPEYSFNLYIVSNSETYHKVSLFFGNTGGVKTHALSYNIYNLWQYNNFGGDLAVHLMRQPVLFTNLYQKEMRYSSGIYKTINWQATNKLLALLQLGVKEEGYIQGEPLRRDIVMRAGIKLDLS